MGLEDHLRKKSVSVGEKTRSHRPLWKGPEVGGVTFSLLSRFLCCRERFRLKVVEGLEPADRFSHRLSYGQMWHTCEEAFASEVPSREGGAIDCAFSALRDYVIELAQRYPMERQHIEHWAQACRVQFPAYVKHWQKHPDVKGRIPLFQEQEFSVPYTLPSGRVVRLRGKRDSGDLIDGSVYLQENKTKGDVDPQALRNQLHFDLQTMLYLVSLYEQPSCDLPRWGYYRHSDGKEYPIGGVRYNVIRRPLSGGKYSIVQHKPSKSNPNGEGKREYYARLGALIQEDPGYFFMRWKAEVTSQDVVKFKRECLDPILEQLCDWWEYITAGPEAHAALVCERIGAGYRPTPHWRHPFGVYNVLNEGGSTDLDEFLINGSMVGLARAERLFPELSSDD